ncbi:MAG: SapC family protein [Pseudoxanthomonas sp.]
MTRHALLNNIDHRDLRVAIGHGAQWGDAEMAALTFPAEFRNIQAHYPIVFQKTGDDGFQPLALLGLRQGENLFLDPQARTGTGWDAWYVPMSMRRQPFLIGQDAEGGMAVHVDLDHPRVGAAEGQALFLLHGGTSEFLQGVSDLLGQLHGGVAQTPEFVAALMRAQLLESFVLDIESADGAQRRVAGLYAIHEERLRALEGPTLEALHREGWLEAAWMAVASLAHLRDLIERDRRRHAG